MVGPSSSVSYEYNGLGDRLRETVNGVPTTFIMDLNAGLSQVLSNGTNDYLYGNGRIAQMNTETLMTDYFLTDALGSVRQLTDSAGAVTLANAYDPYGVVTQTSGSGGSTYGYTGEMTDPTGMVYLRARYYMPNTGRFLTRDTWNGDYNRPLSLNRWNYVEGNPVNYTDPTGQKAFNAVIPPPNNINSILWNWFTGADVGYCGSGWGYGPRQWLARQLGLTDNANNVWELLRLSLLEFDHAHITGQALEEIKQDPELLYWQKIWIEEGKRNPYYGLMSFPYEETKQIVFGGERAPANMLLQIINPSNPEYAATWKVAVNELTWMIRSATVSASISVSSQREFLISYALDDTLDLRPGPDRSVSYNLATAFLGLIYHDEYGGNDKMKVFANWTTSIK